MEANLLERKKDRDRLFAVKPYDISKLSCPDQYMRMRYEREIEAAWYVKLLRQGLSHKDAAIQATKEANVMVKIWGIASTVYNIT